MHALIFAAGLGERMRPLTRHTPKPLLHAGGKPLIAWHLEKLAAIGVREVVVNTSWLADQFPRELGDGSRWGLRLHFAYEGPTPLETGGGMLHALELLGPGPFLAVNGDIWTDFDFRELLVPPEGDARLVLVDNPPHHPGGDFHLHPNGAIRTRGGTRLTFAGVGTYHPRLLERWREVANPAAASDGRPAFKLAPLLHDAVARGRTSGIHHRGQWTDVGTPERLELLDRRLMPA